MRNRSKSYTPKSASSPSSAIFTLKGHNVRTGLQAVSKARRQEMIITHDEIKLSIAKQCDLLSISRSSFYYTPIGENPLNVKLMMLIDEQFLDTPWYGARQMARHLRRQGYNVGRKRVRRLMQKMGLHAIYQEPKTTVPNPEHKVYPYLLRNLEITRPNQVWCTDITYIRMHKGFLYLVAIMDWHSRKVLSWRLSNTMDANFCIEALEEAIEKHGTPEIFNTDQGSQFTSMSFTEVLKHNNIRISMDGKGRWMDNVFIERLWRSLKYECVYLQAFESGSQAKQKIGNWIQYYNTKRPHSTFGEKTPFEVYYDLPVNGTLDNQVEKAA